MSCTCTYHADYRQLDRACPQHGDEAERRRRRGNRIIEFTEETLRERDECIMRATLDWWDFDGSYRAANDYDDDDLSVDEVLKQAGLDR